jgi:acylphosphatase
MIRVTRIDGAVVIITNGTPDKRLNDLKQFSSEANYNIDIQYEKIELS